MKGTRFIVTIIMLGMFAAGCVTPNPCVTIFEERPEQAGIEMNSVHIIDPALESKTIMATYCEGVRMGPGPKEPAGMAPGAETYKISIEQYDSDRSATGTRKVWAVIRNHTNFPLQVEGRTHFFDSHKTPSEEPTAWQRVQLAPKSIGTYKEFSKRENAEYYHIEIREQH